MTPQHEQAELQAVRENAGLFQLPERAVLEVLGEDRVRWLDGMISADVKSLAVGGGAPGLLLTPLLPRVALLPRWQVRL